ncbi:DUF2306 domain-containing protein [Tunturiibacter empetritectus]|uniref:DUF2306 domain-containing protein n=1 Tax=Tunturiibacter lichenicola TaxID=2051959 RepID=A0A852V7I1_9BACT|nr:DUF2306 domain-containing protein [Edaphobacter lichenicola]NYF88948.1 hypothetical protein [Edaphobacter lichenicola]
MSANAPVEGVARGVYPAWLKVGFWICVVIAVAVVLRRVAVLAHPGQGGSGGLSPTAALDAVFASHAALTLAHIVPAMAFVLLSPLVLLQRPTTMWAERLFFPLGAWVGVTAYAMSAYPVGGWVERSAVLLFNSLFLFSLLRAFVAVRRGDAVERMRWMLRAVAILLGIATTRPGMGVFFATSRLTHLEPAQFFGIAFWIGFSINTIAIELWLRSRGNRLPVAG